MGRVRHRSNNVETTSDCGIVELSRSVVKKLAIRCSIYLKSNNERNYNKEHRYTNCSTSKL
jgi:hypothetical protein